MRQVTTFNEWISEKINFEESKLRELNEAFDPKDEMRIKDILRKADGDASKAVSLAKTMANKIEDAAKAIRRGDAAKEQEANALAEIFYARAKELGADIDSEDSNTDKDLDASPKDSREDSKEEKSEKIRKQKTPKPEKLKPGDHVIVTGRMVKEGKVGLANQGGWRWIEPSSSQERTLTVNAPDRIKRSAGHGRSRHTFYDKIPASAKISRSYLDEHLDEGIFYVKITKSGSMWIEGIPVFFNGLIFTSSGSKIRIQTKNLQPNGPELEIILSSIKEIDSSMYTAKFFMGDEDFVMNSKGNSIEDFSPGVYAIDTLNFELTVKKQKPVVYCFPVNLRYKNERMESEKVIFAPIDKVIELKDSYTPEQFKVIADYIAKELGAKIEYPEEDSKITANTSYKIYWFIVKSILDHEKSLSAYNASPFFSREKAEEHIAEIKSKFEKGEKFPFDVKTLQVKMCDQWSTFNLDFQQLIEYAKIAGIEIKLKKFMEEKRGALASKKFGF